MRTIIPGTGLHDGAGKKYHTLERLGLVGGFDRAELDSLLMPRPRAPSFVRLVPDTQSRFFYCYLTSFVTISYALIQLNVPHVFAKD